jgi:hypothetical protein
MKAIIIILLISLLNACSTLKIYTEIDCDINIKLIEKEIKKQKAKISSARITTAHEVKDKNNCSVLILHIDKWKDVKRQRFLSSCLILKTVNDIYINTYYRNRVYTGEIDKEIADTYIDAAIQSFKVKNKLNFDSQTLNEIESKFRCGINIFVFGVPIDWYSLE